MKDYCPNGFETRDDIIRSLDFVMRKGAVLLLAAAVLRREWLHLEKDAEREAVVAIEGFARHKASRRTALEALTLAEQETEARFWIQWDYCDCDCCWEREIPPDDESIHSGARTLLTEPSFFTARCIERVRRLAPDALLELHAQRQLYSDIIGPAFWTPDSMGEARHDPHVRELVAGLDREREIDGLGMLALGDALEEAGCTNEEMLEHCRGGGPHVRGCWVIEELSGRSALRLPLREEDEPAKKKRPAPLIPMRRHIVRPPARMKPVS